MQTAIKLTKNEREEIKNKILTHEVILDLKE